MFAFFLLVLAFGLFFASFILLITDLTSTKRNNKSPADEKLPKLGKYSFLFNLIALLLLVFVSFL